jgi:hypothetical protein
MLIQSRQCLAVHTCPVRRRNVYHVGYHVSRTATPSHLTATKRPPTRTESRALDTSSREGKDPSIAVVYVDTGQGHEVAQRAI